MCTCPKNTWLRGFEFPENKKDKYLDEWQGNHCNVLSGYFWNQCEAVKSNGQNDWTVCPMGKFLTGMGRGDDALGATD